jgi:hypothetical protein
MIINAEIAVNGYKAKVSPKITLYQTDSLYLEFSLYNTIIDLINGIDSEEKIPFEALEKVELKLENPFGIDTLQTCDLNGNVCRFLIKEEHTSHVGIYHLQLVCYDVHGCKFHIPPITYEIRQPLS